jgi:hypothetical protein
LREREIEKVDERGTQRKRERGRESLGNWMREGYIYRERD